MNNRLFIQAGKEISPLKSTLIVFDETDEIDRFSKNEYKNLVKQKMDELREDWKRMFLFGQ